MDDIRVGQLRQWSTDDHEWPASGHAPGLFLVVEQAPDWGGEQTWRIMEGSAVRGNFTSRTLAFESRLVHETR